MRIAGLAALAAAAALAVAGCGATGHIEPGAGDATAGKRLFTANCAGCHVLEDANAQGTSGPNLDQAFGCAMEQGFDASIVRDVVRGQIAYASPPMPRDLVTGKDADAVAEYVTEAVQRAHPECSSTKTTLTAPTR